MKSRYLLFQKAEAALIDEKAEKLFGITRLLDSYLEGGFSDLIDLQGVLSGPFRRSSEISLVNEALRPFVDMVTASYKGVGAGYYSKELKAIVAYGPSERFGSKVGLDLGPDHLGWQAMESGKEIVGVGSMVRGEIMNCMRPLVRNGETIGFVWANETVEDIYAQIRMGAKDVFFSQNVEPLLGLTGLLMFTSRVLLFDDTGQKNSSSIVSGLERLQRYIKLFLDSLSLGVILVETDGHISFVSSGMSDVLGVPREEFNGKLIEEALAEIGIDPYFALEDSESGAKNRFANIAIPTVDGDKLVTMVTTVVGLAESSNAHGGKGGTGYIILLEDLKEARAEEERIERIERLAAAGELAAAIAHEVKNPLTVVKGAVSLVPQRLSDTQFLSEFSNVVSYEIDRIDLTIESLLSFSRFSQPQKFDIDMIQVLKHACDLILPYAKMNKVDISFCRGLETLPISGDRDHLVQAFMNLMLNAIQAMPDGGTILVSANYTAGARYCTVTVEDSGIGIAPENQDHIFDMFFTTRKGGTGLGLPLVQRIIYEHQGFLEVESTPGEGTRFLIKLPVLETTTV
ncbi:MAG TPA: ATP-binding protein [Bacillota bacterium]|nr:ATP-binding protein [Bacillota bacterium]